MHSSFFKLYFLIIYLQNEIYRLISLGYKGQQKRERINMIFLRIKEGCSMTFYIYIHLDYRIR